MVTKKLITIISVLITIICLLTAIQVNVYADSQSADFSWNNTTNKNMSYFNVNNSFSSYVSWGNGTIFDGSNRLMETNISRYTHRNCEITYNFSFLKFELDFVIQSGTFNSQNFKDKLMSFISSGSFVNNTSTNNNLGISFTFVDSEILDYSLGSYNISVSTSGQKVFATYYFYNLVLKYNLPLTNIQSLQANYFNQVYISKLRFTICNSQINLDNGCVLRLSNIDALESNSIQYIFSIDFGYPSVVASTIYVMSLIDIDSSSFGYIKNFNTEMYNQWGNRNVTPTFTTEPSVSLCCNLYEYNFTNNSDVQFVSTKCYSQSNAQIKTYNFQWNESIGFSIYTSTPLILNDVSQNNITFADTENPLKLKYYDASWYEIHKQIANGVIFVLTEMPIISNIVNAVIDMFNTITAAFNTLTNFDNFGLIFTFGMFCIVFGVLVSLM